MVFADPDLRKPVQKREVLRLTITEEGLREPNHGDELPDPVQRRIQGQVETVTFLHGIKEFLLHPPFPELSPGRIRGRGQVQDGLVQVSNQTRLGQFRGQCGLPEGRWSVKKLCRIFGQQGVHAPIPELSLVGRIAGQRNAGLAEE